MYPTDYIQQLKRERGVRGRKKARAFQEYWDDMEHGDHNSVGFYAKSWDVSKSTAHDWIKDFDIESDRFTNYLYLKSKQHYSSVVNQTERTERLQPNEPNAYEQREQGSFEEVTERTERTQPNEAFNINNNTARERNTLMVDPEFSYLYSTCRLVNKNVGAKADAYDAWDRIKKISNVRYQDMAAMYTLYYLDSGTHDGKPYGLAKFLMNEIYMSYSKPYVKLTNSMKEEFVGWYDRDAGVLEMENGPLSIPSNTFNSILQSGGVEILPQMKAKV
jgi:hypothetical protein